MDPHYLECARAALALRIEGARSKDDRRELRRWLAEIEAEAKRDALSPEL